MDLFPISVALLPSSSWSDSLQRMKSGRYVCSLTHWGRVTHICVGKLTIIDSDDGLSPAGRQAIIWTNVGILLIWPLGTNFNEILIEIYIFSFKKMHLKMSSVKWRPFCLGLNVLKMVNVSSGGPSHYSDVMMRVKVFQVIGVLIVCSIVRSDADQRKYKNSAPLVFVRRIHRWPVDSPHKGPVTRKMFPFDDVIIESDGI